MKKYLCLFFILFSLSALSAQNLNFKDTNAIKTLLSSRHWIRYNLNADSSFSGNISDSIVFNADGTFRKSAEHKISALPDFVHDPVLVGKWSLGPSKKIIANHSSIYYIYVVLNVSKNKVIKTREFMLVDGHRSHGNQVAKTIGNIDQPFIAWWDTTNGLKYDKYEIWQARREIKK
jgi:hypothetical protein